MMLISIGRALIITSTVENNQSRNICAEVAVTQLVDHHLLIKIACDTNVFFEKSETKYLML